MSRISLILHEAEVKPRLSIDLLRIRRFLKLQFCNNYNCIINVNACHYYWLQGNALKLYVTGYWKIDHNVTLGQLLFVGATNSHTHTLPMHCCINGLSGLVCFSRAGVADHVKSQLRQWDPWGH